MADDPFAVAAAAAAELGRRTGVDRHDVFVVLGSGWARVADLLPAGVDVPMADLTGFPRPTSMGHGASLRSVDVGGAQVLLALGRVHLFEGYPPDAVVHGVRVAAAAGCRAVVLTNASGSLRTEWPLGAPVLITDQINFTGRSPLVGPSVPERFTSMTDAFSPRLRALAREVDATLREGVYMGFHGPQFETPAEVRAAGVLGADLVGMSTVLEVIAARHAGLEVLGVSLVTNLAAGIAGTAPLDAAHVVAVGESSAPVVGDLLHRVLRRIAGAR